MYTTINGVDGKGLFVVQEPENSIRIRFDQSKPSLILTTSPTVVAKSSILYVQGNGEYHCFSGSMTRRRNMQSYLIMLTLEGKEVLEYQNTRYEMSPREFYWIDCMAPHYAYTPPQPQPRHAMWVHFNGVTAAFYYQQFLRMNSHLAVSRLPEDDDVANTIRQLINLYNGHNASLATDILASALMTSVVVSCLQATAARQMSNTSLPAYVQGVKAHIKCHYQQNITLDSLALQFSVNKYHLQKQFKRYLGLSPGEYLTHIRMTNAKTLLRSTNLSVGDIAREVGFDNVGNFSRVFKRFEDITPMLYRRHWLDPKITGYPQDGAPEEADADGARRTDTENGALRAKQHVQTTQEPAAYDPADYLE